MAVTVGNNSTATQSFANSISVARPTGADTGSVIYLYFNGGQPPSSTPSGFTAVSGANVSSDFGYGWHQYTYYKVISDIGTEPTTYTVNASFQDYLELVAVDLIGCDTSDPIGGTPTQNSGSGTTATGLSITADRDGSMLMAATVSSEGARTAGYGGMTNTVTHDTNVYVDQQAVDAGATGNKTCTYTTQGWVVDLIVFQPEASTGNNATIAETAAEFTEASSVAVEVDAAVAETAAEFTESIGVDHAEIGASVAETAAEFTESIGGTVDLDVAIGETAAEFQEAIFSASMQLLLSASTNGRYLEDQGGNPYFVHGEAAWSLIGVLSQTDAETYLDDRASRGLNCVVVNLIENNFSPDPPNNEAGQGPYSGTMFQSATNSSYWSFVDWFIQACADRGIVVIANPAYIGFNDGEGVGAEVNAASTGQMQTYGEFIGARYASYQNIIWCLYGDRDTYGTKMDALQTGISNQDSNHSLYMAHYGPNVSSVENAPSWLTLNWVYSYEADIGFGSQFTYEEVEDGWDFVGPIPALLTEAQYELESGTDAERVRRQIYHAVLAGSPGHVYGHRDIWGFGYGINQVGSWQSALNDTGIVHAGRARDFFEAIAWHTLVPQHNGDTTLVTSGRGTYGDINWAVAGVNAAGTVGAVYRQGFGTSVTVDLSLFAGEITARWYDPTNGSYTADAASPLTNTGTHSFSRGSTNAAGDNDWVLLLEAEGPDNASIAETAAEFTESVGATVEVAAAVAETAAEFTEAVGGSVEVVASIAETAAEFTEAIGASVDVVAAVAETAAEFTEAVAGDVDVAAAVAETAAEFTEAASATVVVDASVAETAAEFTEAIGASVDNGEIDAAVAEVAAEFTESVGGTVEVAGSTAETVAEFTEAASVSVEVEAAVAETAAEFQESISGTDAHTASISEVAAEFIEAVASTVEVGAAAAETAAEFTETLGGDVDVAGAIPEVAAEFVESVAGSVEVVASISETAAEFTESIESFDTAADIADVAAEFVEAVAASVSLSGSIGDTAAEFVEASEVQHDIAAILEGVGMHPRRYYLLKTKSPEYDRYSALPLVWRAKQQETAGHKLPSSFPGKSLLETAGYSTYEDLHGATASELTTYANLSLSLANQVLALVP